MWDVKSGAELEAIAAGDTIVRVAFLADGKRVLTVDNTGMMKLWQVTPRAPVTNDCVTLQRWLTATTDVIARPDRILASP